MCIFTLPTSGRQPRSSKWDVTKGSKIRIDHMIDQNNRELCNAGSECSHIVVTTKLCERCLERNCFGITQGKSLTTHWLAVMGRRRKRGLDTGMTICCLIDCMSMKNTACLDIYTSKMATEIQQGLKSALSQCPNSRVIINLKIVHIHKNNKQKFLS